MFRMFEMKKRGLAGTLMLTAILLTFMFTIVTVSAIDLGGHTIEFVGVVYNGDGTSTWTYDVTATTGERRGISHWMIAWCGGEASVIDTSWDPWSYGKDQSTGLWGIKFDELSEGLNDFKGETRTFWFILDDHYPSSLVPVGIKDGAGSYVGLITGPVAYTFSSDLTVVNTGLGPLGWSMSATATDSSGDIVRVVFNWYGPFGSETTSSAGLTAALTTTDDSSPFESAYGALTDDDLGWWLITAEFYVYEENGYYLKAYASDTIDLIIETPWFTSLPLAMLVTVGAVIFLRKKGRLSLFT